MLEKVVVIRSAPTRRFIGLIFWYIFILVSCFGLAQFGWLEALRSLVVPGMGQWQTLARVQGGISPQGPWVEVIKTQTPEGLKLQVSIQALNVPLELSELKQQSLHLAKTFDAHAFFQGRWVNLLLVDANQDGYQELLVPYMDTGFKTGIKIYQYDPFIEQFVLRDGDLFN